MALGVAGLDADRLQFREWLMAFAKREGRNRLRQIAQALGHSFGTGSDPVEVVDTIIHATGGNPGRLGTVCEVR